MFECTVPTAGRRLHVAYSISCTDNVNLKLETNARLPGTLSYVHQPYQKVVLKSSCLTPACMPACSLVSSELAASS